MNHNITVAIILIAAIGLCALPAPRAQAARFWRGLKEMAGSHFMCRMYRAGLILYTDIIPASQNTGTSLATLDPNSVRRLWQAGVDTYEQSNDFFAEMEGGPDSPIWERTDTSAGKGQEITFTVGAGFYDEPHIGETLFETSTDFEAFLIASHNLAVDWVRHGTSSSERMEEVMGMRNEIKNGFNTQQGAWLGRLKTEQLFMMFLYSLPPANILYANSKTQDTLKSADYLNWNNIISTGVRMKSLGGKPAKVGTMQNGQPVQRQIVVSCSDALFSLDQDSDYKQLLRETKVEQQATLLFNGGYASPKGHLITEYTPIDHDGEGAVGSPINAKAYLGNAIAAGSAALVITGGNNPTSAAKVQKMYFKYFPNYAYPFIGNIDPTAGGSTVLGLDAQTHYALIINPPNAGAGYVSNGIGMISYTTGNNGNQISVVNRLSANGTSAGINLGTLGSVTNASGPFQGLITEAHPQGALVMPCNALGQVFSDTLMLGKACAYRGYGKYRNKRMTQEKEGGFLMERFLVSVFGQSLRKDRLQRVPAVMRLRHAYNPPGLPLPPIT